MWQDGRLDPTRQETFPGSVLWPEQLGTLEKSRACEGWGWLPLPGVLGGSQNWGKGEKPVARSVVGAFWLGNPSGV